MWLFLVLAIPVTAVLMALFVQASSTVHGAPALPRHPGPKESLARVSLFTLGSFLQQGEIERVCLTVAEQIRG